MLIKPIENITIDLADRENFASQQDFEKYLSDSKIINFSNIFIYNTLSGKVEYREYNIYGDDCDAGEMNDYLPQDHEIIIIPYLMELNQYGNYLNNEERSISHNEEDTPF